MKKYRVEVDKYGTVRWFKYDTSILHRAEGPAVERKNGMVEYRVNGSLHRENGPAIIREDGSEMYYICGKYLTAKEFNARNKSCEGKIVKIDGKRYELRSMEE
jgi:hypothetical protein